MQQNAESPPKIPQTPTVESTIREFTDVISAWEIVKALLSRHPEFGRGMAREIADSEGPRPDPEKSMHADRWLATVFDLFERSMIDQVHGRLFILGLCRIDDNLASYLDTSGFRSAIKDEMFEDFVSLLTPREAGIESYKGVFLRILNNRAKNEPSLGEPRSTGFLVVVNQALGLEPIAQLCSRQSWNSCRTAHYVLPPGSSFGDLLSSFTDDLMSVVKETETTGTLEPNPESDKTWQSYANELADSRETEPPNLPNIFSALGRDDVIRTGQRLVFLAEFRGVIDGASLEDIGLTGPVLSALYAIPERIGMVLSGLPPSILEQLNGPNVTQLTLPADLQRTRSKPLENDTPTGPDHLDIKTEVNALAEAITLADMTPPMVVGVLGGWGSGKSFVLHLIEERIQEIRCERIGPRDSEPPFPFVGHPYVVHFDAWTYAKSNLWASLMHRILVELDRQISLEQIFFKEFGDDVSSNQEIWRFMNRLSEKDKERLTQTDAGLKALKIVNDFQAGKLQEGAIWSALRKFKSEEAAKLRQLETEFVIARQETYISQQEFEQSLDAVLNREGERNAWVSFADGILNVVDQAFSDRLKTLVDHPESKIPTYVEFKKAITPITRFKKSIGLLSIVVGASAVIAAVIIGTTIDLAKEIVGGLAGAAGLLGMLGTTVRFLGAQRKKFQQAMAVNLKTARASRSNRMELEISKAAETLAAQDGSEMEGRSADTETLEARARSLSKSQVNLREKEDELKYQRQRVGITARQENLLDFINSRLSDGYYEDKLGPLHQIQSDLQEFNDAMLDNAARTRSTDPEKQSDLNGEAELADQLFPRGTPRVILMIDDLDRCPPDKVVEVLEAAQLLVKTQLFVVVIAMDVRYVTKALESKYAGVLVRGGEPSGLDYIEKIIQIPYRLRPVSGVFVGRFLNGLMQVPSSSEPAGIVDENPLQSNDLSRQDDREGEAGRIASPESVTTVRVLPTEILEFTSTEHQIITSCCLAVSINPRAMKRLVNVLKLLKIIWHRRGLGNGPTESIKHAMIAFLVLAARYPGVMRPLLQEMEQVYRHRSPERQKTLAGFLSDPCRKLSLDANSLRDWSQVSDAVENPNLLSQTLTLAELRETNLHLVSSFSFIGEAESVSVADPVEELE